MNDGSPSSSSTKLRPTMVLPGRSTKWRSSENLVPPYTRRMAVPPRKTPWTEEPSFTEIPQDETLQLLPDDLIERESGCAAVCNEFCVTSHRQSPLSIVNISVNNRKWR